MIRFLVLFVVFFLVAFPLSAQNFSVSGTKILDPDGNEFIIKGVNVNGPHWPWERETAQDADLIATTWGFNTVRVNAFPRLDFIDNNLDLDAIVEAFTSRGVVTIIEVHDYTGTYPGDNPEYPPLSALVAWWKDKAQRYQDNPYVWFNIMNEPGGLSPAPEKWRTSHEAVIKAIRDTVQANNIIVLDEHHFGQANGFRDPEVSAVLQFGPYFIANYDDITFSLHTYGTWTEGEKRLEAYIDSLHNNNLSFHFGEYGSSARQFLDATRVMYREAILNGIGRIIWHWDGGDGNDLTQGTTQGGGWEITPKDGSMPTNLNTAGMMVWKDLRNTLTPDDSLLTFTFEPLINGSFEQDYQDWNNFGNTEINTSGSFVRDGQKSLKVNPGGTGGAGQRVFLDPGVTYFLSAYGRHRSNPAQAATIGVQYRISDGSQQQHNITFDSQDWQFKSVEFTPPADMEGENVFIFKSDEAAEFYADFIRIRTEEEILSIPPAEKSKLVLFPNPVNKQIRVKGWPSSDIPVPYLITVTGGILSPPSSVEGDTLVISVDKLAEGNYVLQLLGDRFQDSRKVMIER